MGITREAYYSPEYHESDELELRTQQRLNAIKKFRRDNTTGGITRMSKDSFMTILRVMTLINDGDYNEEEVDRMLEEMGIIVDLTDLTFDNSDPESKKNSDSEGDDFIEAIIDLKNENLKVVDDHVEINREGYIYGLNTDIRPLRLRMADATGDIIKDAREYLEIMEIEMKELPKYIRDAFAENDDATIYDYLDKLLRNELIDDDNLVRAQRTHVKRIIREYELERRG